MEIRHGFRNHEQGAGDDPEGDPEAPESKAGRSGQILRAPRRERRDLAEASRLRLARDPIASTRAEPKHIGDARSRRRRLRRGVQTAPHAAMIGLDANILIRHLVQDDPVQSPRASALIERRLSEANPGFVSIVAIAEIVWVLDRVYRFSSRDIAAAIEGVLQTD